MSFEPFHPEEVERTKQYAEELNDEEGRSKYRGWPILPRIMPWVRNDKQFQDEVLISIIRLERASGLLSTAHQRQEIASTYHNYLHNVSDLVPPTAIGTAIYLTLRKKGWNSLRFPFNWGPKKTDGNIFPSAEFQSRHPSLGKLLNASGREATVRWQASRFLAHLAVCSFAAKIIITFSMISMGLSLFHNPALGPLHKGVMQNKAQQMKKIQEWRRQMLSQLPNSAPVTRPPELEIYRFPSLQQSNSPQEENGSLQEQENSPQLDQSIRGSESFSQERMTSTVESQPVFPVSSSQTTRESSLSEFDEYIDGCQDDHDKSPVAPSYRRQQRSPNLKPSQSTWEEIRQRAREQQQGMGMTVWSASSQQSGPSNSEWQENRKPEEVQGTSAHAKKSKAQKDYDAIMEAQRREIVKRSP